MKLNYQLVSALPKMAWIARMNWHDHQTLVQHGPWVEVGAKGFVEGVWDGPFSAIDFDRSACVFGSGAVIRGDSIVFVSSASTTDYLYWCAGPDGACMAVANSLPLLLMSLDDELDPQVKNYDQINNSILSGLNNYTPQIPTCRGSVNRLVHWNLSIASGRAKLEDKPLPPPFAEFNDYASYLAQACVRLAKNARDPLRVRPMEIFSTQSRGYDSTAANAVAKNMGIDLVFTVSKSKGKGYFADEDQHHELNDDGSEICQVLGLPCVPIERRALEKNSAMEYLFYACMQETGDFNLLQIGEYVTRPTVLMTGCLGELWYGENYYKEHPGLINPDLMRGDLGNHGLTEVRLQAGYVQLAFPYIGARRRADIFSITQSAEMAPWRLHTDYDRPIPRRLAEQAGVPRALFGQVKMASLLEYPAPITPVDPDLLQAYREFLVKHGLLSLFQAKLLNWVRRWNAMLWMTSPQRHAWSYYFQRMVSKLLGRPFSFSPVLTRLNGSIFCFCVNRRVVDYRQALATQSNEGTCSSP